MVEVTPDTIGRRFSLNYLHESALLKDSARMRRRLAPFIASALPDRQHGVKNSVKFGELLEAELGIDVLTSGVYGSYVDWEAFLKSAELRDILDLITLGARYLDRVFGATQKQEFLAGCERIFAEEQVGFNLDENGGVHPKIDLEFNRLRGSLLSGLSETKFDAAREYIAKVDENLLLTPIDGRQAIRRTFDLVENIFKIAFPRETHVNSTAIIKVLKPSVETRFPDKSAEKRPALKQVDGFKNWVDTAHFYRHEQGKPEIEQPSENFTFLMVSQGYSYVRWLVAILPFSP